MACTWSSAFTAIAPPNYLGESHLDQPGRYVGTIVLDGEEIPVDAFGFRDRSWGPRSQFGRGIHGTQAMSGGYSYATASDREAFHAITMDFGYRGDWPSTATCSGTGAVEGGVREPGGCSSEIPAPPTPLPGGRSTWWTSRLGSSTPRASAATGWGCS